jgi:hypothetical protein
MTTANILRVPQDPGNHSHVRPADRAAEETHLSGFSENHLSGPEIGILIREFPAAVTVLACGTKKIEGRSRPGAHEQLSSRTVNG